MSNFVSHPASSSPNVILPAPPQPDEAGGLPPGPSGRVLSNFKLIHKPIEALREWQRQYGHTFTVDRLGVPTVMTADPELVGEIYGVRDLELFDAVLPESIDVLLGSQSLLMLSGRRHQRERKLMTPPFHGERMRGWAATMADAARQAFAGSGEIRAAERAQRATLEVIVRVIFGVDDEARVREFVAAVNEWTMAVRSGFLFFRALQRDILGLSPYARYRRALERVDALLFDQIARTRAGAGGRTDVLAGLVEARYEDGGAMDDETIRDHLRTLLFAGHETTAIALAWALHFVHRDDAVRTRLLDELASLGSDPEALARLPYLGAVIDETLRMRPVTVDPFRLLRKPWQMGGWQLPAGSAVCPAVTLIHFREDLWPEPEVFRPERFLEQRPAANTYLPFGGGSHRCLGATFARFEACVILGTVLREVGFEALDRDVQWRRGRGTLEPQGGVRMRVQPRERIGHGLE
jgi:cytochrome P450 family 110